MFLTEILMATPMLPSDLATVWLKATAAFLGRTWSRPRVRSVKSLNENSMLTLRSVCLKHFDLHCFFFKSIQHIEFLFSWCLQLSHYQLKNPPRFRQQCSTGTSRLLGTKSTSRKCSAKTKPSLRPRSWTTPNITVSDMGVSKILVPQNGWFISWKTLLNWMIWVVLPLFLETPICHPFDVSKCITSSHGHRMENNLSIWNIGFAEFLTTIEFSIKSCARFVYSRKKWARPVSAQARFRFREIKIGRGKKEPPERKSID